MTADPMEPTRDLRVTLPDLVDVLLDKGVYLDLDLIVTVADIPLIGVSLRAMVGGIETMLEHGMMQAWDERTREWVRGSLSRRVPLADDEDVVARMAGGHHQEEPYATWRPGTVYLTTRRLMVWRAEPRELLWHTPLDEVTDVGTRTERSAGGPDRTRVALTTPTGTTLLSAAAPERLVAAVRAHAPACGAPVPARRREPLEARVWYLEDLAGGSVWRGGTGTLDPGTGLTWKGVRDVRPAVRLGPDRIRSVDLVQGRTPVGRQLIVVRDDATAVRLATADTARWATALSHLAGPRTPSRTGGST
ncbi:gas vesicle protein [Promicromonospora vindobonensis]|uniref:Gas vesicle protein n=1 Tax=Promicromonospora vindobonensis TaxID=195748 RepID=A0ABW5VMD7_9MICO